MDDPYLEAFDRTRTEEIHDDMNSTDGDFCASVNRLDADFLTVNSACPIHSTAG